MTVGAMPLREYSSRGDALFAVSLSSHWAGKRSVKECRELYNELRFASSDLKDLLVRMLAVDPTQRISMGEVLQHSWLHPPPATPPRRSSSASSLLSTRDLLLSSASSAGLSNRDSTMTPTDPALIAATQRLISARSSISSLTDDQGRRRSFPSIVAELSLMRKLDRACDWFCTVSKFMLLAAVGAIMAYLLMY